MSKRRKAEALETTGSLTLTTLLLALTVVWLWQGHFWS